METQDCLQQGSMLPNLALPATDGRQVGLTGRSVAPRLYLAAGISGKFNHMVGMQRAGLLVAINNNPKAEIFEQCDYGIVGDWASVVPALIQALRQARARLAARPQPETLRA